MTSYFSRATDGSHHEIFPGVHIYTAAAERMMLSLVEFEPGAVVQDHSHMHEQVGILIEGELTFTIGEETRTLVPGEMWRFQGVLSTVLSPDPNRSRHSMFLPRFARIISNQRLPGCRYQPR